MGRRIAAALLAVLALGLMLPTGSTVPLSAKESGKTKRIALTFDDGPSAGYTAEILDILREYDVKATFFVIGKNVEAHPDLLRRTVSEGHEIGNHTYSHPHLKTIDEAKLSEEVVRSATLLQEVAGIRTSLFRPPEGIITPAVTAAAEKGGYRTVLWSIDTMDWALNPAPKIVQTIKREASDGDIVLFHDWVAGDSPTPAALRQIIPWLKDAGFTFVKVSEL
ncbi:MAG: polysaccharide deacetylase family protein [Clostridia bacterium]|nr:polysaccharide deacetylase family protein [Clostridia bacterium]